MGGKDVIYVKQQHSSIVQPTDLCTKLKKLADDKFLKNNVQSRINSEKVKLNNQVSYLIPWDQVSSKSIFFLFTFFDDITCSF